MDKWDNLAIRVCKKGNDVDVTVRMLRRIHARRCNQRTHIWEVARWVCHLVEKYRSPVTGMELIADMQERESYFALWDACQATTIIKELTKKLCFINASDLPDTYNPGLRWENWKKDNLCST